MLLMGRALYVQNETAQRRDGFMNGDVPRTHTHHRRHDASEHVNFFDQFMRSEAEARSLREREADQRWNTPRTTTTNTTKAAAATVGAARRATSAPS